MWFSYKRKLNINSNERKCEYILIVKNRITEYNTTMPMVLFPW